MLRDVVLQVIKAVRLEDNGALRLGAAAQQPRNLLNLLRTRQGTGGPTPSVAVDHCTTPRRKRRSHFGILRVSAGLAVHLLLLEGLHEALRLRIVVGVADPAHAGRNVVLLGEFGAVAAGILDAAIRMVDQAAGPRLARRQRHGERRDRQTRHQMRVQSPADHAAAEGIEHDGQIVNSSCRRM